ncbi:MAG: thiamine diphosphokinase [Treponemataceae bacterium]|nr:thiamine diphosphokinase [Treponemataceae bacterium]
MKKCIIISGGAFAPIEKKYEDEIRQSSFIIACDKGFDNAKKLHLKPDLVIGDFDSVKSRKFKKYPTITLPCRKDDTDTIFAIKTAIERGFDYIYLLCAFGGKRIDHSFANIQSMVYARQRGSTLISFGKNFSCQLLSSEEKICLEKSDYYDYFSIFSFSEKSCGLTIRGAKYECENLTLTDSFPLAVSNGWKEDKVEISLKSGLLLIMESRD